MSLSLIHSSLVKAYVQIYCLDLMLFCDIPVLAIRIRRAGLRTYSLLYLNLQTKQRQSRKKEDVFCNSVLPKA